MSEKITCTVVGADFARAVLAVERSAAQDDSRPVLAGIRMEIAGDRMTLVAADGFRLAIASLACTCGDEAANEANVIVRHEPLVSFAKRAKKAPTVTISPAAGGMWCFRNDKTRDAAIIPAIDGQYPDWRMLANDLAGGELQALATFNARFLAEAAATAPPDTLLTIQRKPNGKIDSPGVLVIRDGNAEIARHIIMPMLTHAEHEAAS